MIEYILGIFALLTLYTEINFFLIKRRIRGPVKIAKGAEPFYKKKGNIGVLLIHGFTSCPADFIDLAKTLTKNNISAYAPLLPGHGTSPERLAVTKYYQWIEEVNTAVDMMAEECKQIYIIGNSLGGNLALIAATKNEKIRGIVTLGAPIYFHHHRINKNIIIPMLRQIKLFQKKKYLKRNIETVKRINKKRFTYDSIPLRSIKHLLKVIDLSKKNLKNITKPILVMQTKNDGVIRNESGEYILKYIKSKKKRLKTVPESYHVFILDKHKDMAKKEIMKFIRETKK